MNKEQTYLSGIRKIGQQINTNSGTATGPFPEGKDWPETLRTAYSICSNCGFPSVVYWGEELSLYYNPEYAHILGDKHPAAFGKPVAEVFPEIWETLKVQLESVKNTHKTLKISDTLFLLERYGYLEECYFNYTLSPLFDAEGSVAGIFNIAIDTTDQKLAQRRTELIGKFISQQHYAQPMNSCIDGCALILQEALADIPFHLLYIKPKNGQYKLVSSFGVNRPHEEINLPIEEMLASGTHIHIESLSDFFSEPIINFFPEPCQEAVVIPLKHEHSSLSGYLVTGLSPRKRLDKNYLAFIQSVSWHIGACFSGATSFDQFVELEEEKDNLLGVISHELKTPITSIKAYSQLAMRNLKKDGEQDAEFLLQRMEVQIEKLNDIVSDMMDGTNFRAGNISYRKHKFDFDEMVRNTVGVYGEKSNHSISMDLNVNQDFNGDKQRLKQVVSNLLSNAIKYASEKSEIKIKTAIIDNELTFSIQDNGIGIKEEEQAKIFERFYRSVNVRHYTFPGIGLGLFIAQEIIKHFSGKIWVNSKPGNGATFQFSIPIIHH